MSPSFALLECVLCGFGRVAALCCFSCYVGADLSASTLIYVVLGESRRICAVLRCVGPVSSGLVLSARLCGFGVVSLHLSYFV